MISASQNKKDNMRNIVAEVIGVTPVVKKIREINDSDIRRGHNEMSGQTGFNIGINHLPNEWLCGNYVNSLFAILQTIPGICSKKDMHSTKNIDTMFNRIYNSQNDYDSLTLYVFATFSCQLHNRTNNWRQFLEFPDSVSFSVFCRSMRQLYKCINNVNNEQQFLQFPGHGFAIIQVAPEQFILTQSYAYEYDHTKNIKIMNLPETLAIMNKFKYITDQKIIGQKFIRYWLDITCVDISEYYGFTVSDTESKFGFTGHYMKFIKNLNTTQFLSHSNHELVEVGRIFE